MDTLKYKNYEGTAECDMARGVLRGKILFINDVVTYESEDVQGLKREFQAAVDDYLETCKQLGRVPQRPCSGSFNVRIGEDLHRWAYELATVSGTSLNDWVTNAIRQMVDKSKPKAVDKRKPARHDKLASAAR